MRWYLEVSLPLNMGKDHLTYHLDVEGGPPGEEGDGSTIHSGPLPPLASTSSALEEAPRKPATEMQQTAASPAPETAAKASAGPSPLPAPGCRVVVPLVNRLLIGYVIACHDRPPGFPTMGVRQVLDPLPLLPPELVALGLWMAETCVCTPGEAFHCMLPGGLKQQIGRFVRPGPRAASADEASFPEGRWLAEHGRAPLKAFTEAFPRASRWLAEWTRQGLITLEHELSRAAGPRTTTVLVLPQDRPLDLEALTPKERLAVECLLRVNTPLAPGQLARQAGVSDSVVRALVRKGIVDARQERTFRQVDNALRGPAASTPLVALSAEQEKALAVIRDAARSDRQPVLLHGVTCSGKTEVYLRWVAEEVAAGRGAIVLVPEIALTPQMVSRFRSRFGDRVAILHSRLSDGERFDQWELIRRGICPVVVGARSAVFAPVPRLGTIILDEEGEASFKQADAPRYHAREVARQRCRLENALLVMGSATPTLDTYHLATQGAIRLVEMRHRVADRVPPRVQVVDMRHELVARHNRSMFSEALSQALRRTLAAGQQAILFLNRRGFSSFVFCRACGQAAECSRCQVSLVYHSGSRILRCHYCGEARPLPTACPACGSQAIRYFGAGTQRIEAEARRYFPQARLARVDSDTTSAKGSLEEILTRFGAREIDVLIGTQMVAKGLDFPGVTLVGILAADSLLRLPDFRAAERNFALLSQVAGRAGRGREPGTVILQTYAPEHHSIRYALTEDYLGFYREELPHREASRFPPFRQVASLLFTASTAEKGEAAALAFRDRLLAANRFDQGDVLGPAPAPIPRINNQFRFQMLLRDHHRERLAAAIRTALAAPLPSGVKVAVDLDPYFVL